MINFLAYTSQLSGSNDTPIFMSSQSSELTTIGPLVGDGAPFSSIRLADLKFRRCRLLVDRDLLDAISSMFHGCNHWPFGSEGHPS